MHLKGKLENLGSLNINHLQSAVQSVHIGQIGLVDSNKGEHPAISNDESCEAWENSSQLHSCISVIKPIMLLNDICDIIISASSSCKDKSKHNYCSPWPQFW